jgi:NTP pyrophosphatase (non-canonical NTP hydrolase)
MNTTEHLLTCLGEECVEVAKEVSKALRFGLDDKKPGHPETNRERIALEFADALAIIEMLEESGILKRVTDTRVIDRKKARVKARMDYAAQRGTLVMPNAVGQPTPEQASPSGSR